MTTNLTIEDYSIDDLLQVASGAQQISWKLRRHPKRDALTIYSKSGYVIHPNLGYVNDEADAAFIATFDPPMVLSLLNRLAELQGQELQG